MYNHLDPVALIAEWVQLQLGRARWFHVRNAEPNDISQRCVHGDGDEHSEWLREPSNGSCQPGHRASWSFCDRWTVDVYDDISSIAFLTV